MRDIITIALMGMGSLFMLLASLGLIRFPDIYVRMSATTKAATFGGGCIVMASAIYFNDVGVTSRAIGIIVFLLLTAPIAAHMIGRAAYMAGIPLWKGTVIDEMKGRYDLKNNTLASGPAPAPEPREGEDDDTKGTTAK